MKAQYIGRVRSVTFSEMFEHVSSCFYDVCRDAFDDEGHSMEFNALVNIQESIIKRDRQGIARALFDGYTVMMVPDFCESLNELRIINDQSKVVEMVFVGRELNW